MGVETGYLPLTRIFSCLPNYSERKMHRVVKNKAERQLTCQFWSNFGIPQEVSSLYGLYGNDEPDNLPDLKNTIKESVRHHVEHLAHLFRHEPRFSSLAFYKVYNRNSYLMYFPMDEGTLFPLGTFEIDQRGKAAELLQLLTLGFVTHNQKLPVHLLHPCFSDNERLFLRALIDENLTPYQLSKGKLYAAVHPENRGKTLSTSDNSLLFAIGKSINNKILYYNRLYRFKIVEEVENTGDSYRLTLNLAKLLQARQG